MERYRRSISTLRRIGETCCHKACQRARSSARVRLMSGGGRARALLWGLQLTFAVPAGDAEEKSQLDVSPPSPGQKPRALYMPHGIQMPTAPYPARRRNAPPARYPSPGAEQLFRNAPSPIGFESMGYRGRIGPQQPFRPRQQFAAPMNPWYGLPVPTPLGPYSQRRPLKPLPARPPPPEPRGPPAPLRDVDPSKKGHAADIFSESVAWQPDTWRGAQERRPVRPPAPERLGALLPPHMRVGGSGPKGAARTEAPDSEEVGYVDAPQVQEPTGPQYSEESFLRMLNTTSTRHTTRAYLWRPPPTVLPPELLGADDAALLGWEPSPDDDAALLSDQDAAAAPARARRRCGLRSRAAPHSYISNPLLL